jgi:TPP-dependent pyruvate/acetoin dehydrogenase alpha subunit
LVHSLEKIETLLELYKVAFKIRYVETQIAREYGDGEMRCPVHLSIGQELPSAVLSLFQRKDDYAVSTHRAHAHYLAKGGDINQMLAEIYGKSTGCSKGRGGSMHLSDPKVRFMGSSAIVGNSIPVGIGIAYGIKLRKENSQSIVFLGDGATEEGVFYESINFSIIHSLPVVFVCENNFYSVYTGLQSRQPEKRKISNVVEAMGMRAFHVPFGNLEVALETFREAMEEKNSGPKFIEIETYRWLEHCGPNKDDHLNYRPDDEAKTYLEYDFLKDLKSRLQILHSNSESEILGIEAEIEETVKKAFQFAWDSPFPTLEDAQGDFYEESK